MTNGLRGRPMKWDFRAILSEFMSTRSRGECWEWPGVKGKKGYGQAWNGTRQVYVHRWAYETVFGPPGPGMDVLHECDNPSCLNPWHLFPGTDQNNADDRVLKGRHLRKLTVDGVCAIALDRRHYEEIAAEYGISITVVHQIKGGKKYKLTLAERGITPYIPTHEQKHPPQKLTEETARAIYGDTRTTRAIGATYGVSNPTVTGIKNGVIWKHIHAEAVAAGRGHVKNPRKRAA